MILFDFSHFSHCGFFSGNSFLLRYRSFRAKFPTITTFPTGFIHYIERGNVCFSDFLSLYIVYFLWEKWEKWEAVLISVGFESFSKWEIYFQSGKSGK